MRHQKSAGQNPSSRPGKRPGKSGPGKQRVDHLKQPLERATIALENPAPEFAKLLRLVTIGEQFPDNTCDLLRILYKTASAGLDKHVSYFLRIEDVRPAHERDAEGEAEDQKTANLGDCHRFWLLG